MFPVFALMHPVSIHLSLRNFENKVLFINYWATWCNPCLAEMPSMAELYNQYKENNNIVFLYLSKEDADTIIDYIPKNSSLEQLPIYKIVTERFIRCFRVSFSNSLRMITSLDVKKIERIKFGDYLSSVNKPCLMSVFKFDALNPTYSFKDRASDLVCAVAVLVTPLVALPLGSVVARQNSSSGFPQ